MGKREVRVIAVPKSVTIALLVLVSGSMVVLIWLLSGKTYAKQTHPILETIARIMQYRHISSDALLASLMPAIANTFLFVPWGFLIDRKSTRLNSSHLVISYAVFCL